MGLLERRLFYLLSSSSTALKSTLFASPYHVVFSLLRFSTATSQDPSPKTPFQVEYLINSCGLSPDRAVEASKYLAHLRSPSKPTSVVGFLKQFGFGDEHIRKIVSWYPKVLCASVNNTLKPRIKVLQELRFSDCEIVQLVSSSPLALICGELQRRIEFWRPLFETNKQLLKAVARNHHLLSANLGKRIMPNILLLRDCGISDDQIGKMILKIPWLITRSLPSVKSLIQRAEELGVPRGSGMFLTALHAVSSSSSTRIKAKFKFLTSLGWSEADVAFVISKAPFLLYRSEKGICDKMNFLRKVGCGLQYVAHRPGLLTYSLEGRMIPRYGVLKNLKANELPEGDLDFYSAVMISEESICDKMDFLRKEVGCELQYVAHRPGLLTYSLEGRMIPRYGVLKNLKANELPEGDLDFYSAVMISEDKFLNKFVLPHKDRIPGLYETYVASTAGKVPIDCKF
uniref:Transcription termination factor MTERF8, chloroplastic n=1 Tax=Elaeis guineensis var. tenera TaxID=51953 RepID=A0A6I9QA59_ELAGV|nr:transcription termination factor MTERF8, chloroplastic [Elaeis guineensis]